MLKFQNYKWDWFDRLGIEKVFEFIEEEALEEHIGQHKKHNIGYNTRKKMVYVIMKPFKDYKIYIISAETDSGDYLYGECEIIIENKNSRYYISEFEETGDFLEYYRGETDITKKEFNNWLKTK